MPSQATEREIYLTAIFATLQCHTFLGVLSAMYTVSKEHDESCYSGYAAGLFNLDANLTCTSIQPVKIT